MSFKLPLRISARAAPSRLSTATELSIIALAVHCPAISGWIIMTSDISFPLESS